MLVSMFSKAARSRRYHEPCSGGAGCLAAWLPGSLAERLPGCLPAWLPDNWRGCNSLPSQAKMLPLLRQRDRTFITLTKGMDSPDSIGPEASTIRC